MDDRTFTRQVAQGTWKSIVKGAYHSKTDLISDECLGDWMVPIWDKLFETHAKCKEDPMSLSIGEAKDFVTSLVDLFYKNKESCQVGKVYDDYKNWCVDNLDMCVGSDDNAMERIYAHGPDLFAAFYDLAGVYMFESSECSTDAEYIAQNNKIIADTISVATVLTGFEADYNVKSNHITNKNFHEQISTYLTDLYDSYMDNYINTYGSSVDYGMDMDYGLDFSPANIGFNWKNDMPALDFSPENIGFNWKNDMPSWSQKDFEMPELEMPKFDMPSFPEMEMPEFKEFKFW